MVTIEAIAIVALLLLIGSILHRSFAVALLQLDGIKIGSNE
jgi:hypothetical protein